MKRGIAFLITILAALTLFARNVEGFEKGWKFIQQDVTLEQTAHTEGWRTVDLPHDWSIEGEFSKDNPTGQGGWLPAGIGWYVKEFEYDRDGRVFLEFDGIMSHSTVFVNGREVGFRANGYASFSYDVSDFIIRGKNRVAVRVDNSVQPASRWYTGSGINRMVRLVCKSDVFIPYNGIFHYYDGKDIVIETDVCNMSGRKRKVSVRSEWKSTFGESSSETVVLKPGERKTLGMRIDGNNLDEWSLEKPYKYYFTDVQLVIDGRVVDAERIEFAKRTIRFDKETGFWLNDKNVKLKGVCLHSDAGALGTTSSVDVWEHRLLTLKDLGVNAIRWAHNAPDPELLKLCDRMGFLVMVESFDTWEAAKPHAEKGYNLDFNDNWRIDTEDMVKMARNHFSVVMYSVGNEIRDNLDNEDGFRKYRQQQDLIHELDPTRPVTMALFRPNSSGVYRNGFAEMMDVVGQNYRVDELRAYHNAHPEKAIIGTENTHDIQSWLMLRDDPSLCGQFLWTGIEYLGEAEWPQVSWNTALLDITGAVKPLGLQRKSWWTKEPMVAFARHEGRELVSDWNPKDTASVQQIEVYSNCKEVELVLNGRSFGRKVMPSDARPAIYKVEFEPGELAVLAYDGDNCIARSKAVTAGEPYAISLDDEEYNSCEVRATVVDRFGNVCPDNDIEITFSTLGPVRILATDNGDPMDHVNHQVPVRRTWHGSCVAYVSGFDDNSVIIASAPGLKSDTISNWDMEKEDQYWLANLISNTVSVDGLSMKFSYQIFGDKPDDGRSMYISMHGGGNTAHSVNDSQWENQKRLYKPDEGVYVCPRAPWDDWDMWFKAPIDGLLEELIRTMVVELGVNPNKVYLMGYSAGGDGVWRLAPRLADHFAAAAMMAGHPGDVHLENVRNMPFTIWVGGDDAAYNRNVEVAKRGLELDSLQASDPEGYRHETHVLEGKPHWMDLEDAAAVPWMAQFVRNPNPDRIVWRQEEVCRPSFYWISVPEDEMERGKTVIVNRKGDTYEIERCDYSRLTIHYFEDAELYDRFIPTVKYKGKKIKEKDIHYHYIDSFEQLDWKETHPEDCNNFNAYVTVDL